MSEPWWSGTSCPVSPGKATFDMMGNTVAVATAPASAQHLPRPIGPLCELSAVEWSNLRMKDGVTSVRRATSPNSTSAERS